ncbi:DNA protecting protein DprA [Hahella sp. CCB-MM4]|uniref:DNA-processing protein DprA n=1 Tax=Hahella sp. (strain CCB-MM4) TaxID=1926491 RepID=UPI000B9C4895|nr:DNA-processing protein DprA [Hahella sp. CCB-MM4]OZG73258.1 DNA protecting protein DprA [Hahella sp. CCB-MM4]
MNNSALSIWLNLAMLPGLGASRLAKLAPVFDAQGRVKESQLECILSQLPSGLRQQISKVIYQTGFSSGSPEAEDILRWLEQEGHHVLTLIQPEYPALLKLLDDPPPLLYLRGQGNLLYQPQLAMVGSRSPSAQGMDTARQFARSLGEGGFTITSGLAAGIDGAAHQGAVDTLGSTIAVMGSGIDIVYPARHRQLADRIAENGLLVSELSPTMPPMAQHFPRRNRIISGLSLGTIVVEASMRSGSLITARTALEQHREVFAIPGSIHNPQARGCHHLIKQGAKLVESTDDIFVELPALMRFYQQQQNMAMIGLQPEEVGKSPVENVINSRKQSTSGSHQDRQEAQDLILIHPGNPSSQSKDPVLEAVGYDLTHTDQIVERTGLTVADVQTRLMVLELEGSIRSDRGGFIRVA